MQYEPMGPGDPRSIRVGLGVGLAIAAIHLALQFWSQNGNGVLFGFLLFGMYAVASVVLWAIDTYPR